MNDTQMRFIAPVDQLPVEKLPISSIRSGDSPRLNGEESGHVELLAQVEGALPPILVHRATMRVIDGMHRMRAAQLQGIMEIDVRFFDGNEEDAFVLAVQSNIMHGLPLMLSDRIAAATRILCVNPVWSNRAIALKTGLAPATVGGIRDRSIELSENLSSRRLGRDGRLRPIDSAAGRRRAGALIAAKPHASLRQIGQEARVSPATARDVRRRMARGEDPVPSKSGETPQNARRARRTGSRKMSQAELVVVLQRLRQDPSLRYTEVGRGMLAWISTHVRSAGSLREFLGKVPPHCIEPLAVLARGCANSWDSFADELESDARGETRSEIRPDGDRLERHGTASTNPDGARTSGN
jgi:hypothetical protein